MFETWTKLEHEQQRMINQNDPDYLEWLGVACVYPRHELPLQE